MEKTQAYLDFEAPVAHFENKITELRTLSDGDDEVSLEKEIGELEAKAKKSLEKLYADLTPWQKTQVARHPHRPHTVDYIEAFVEDFTPFAGDRAFGEDAAIVAGPGRIGNHSVMIIGQEKGHDTTSRLKHNFGMARPEGYRKAVRLMQMAERFSLPVVTFIDTAGAYPGIGAEERGQAEAIARSTACCLSLKVPIIAVIIGEGGSGGAIALASADRVLMMQNAIYSVISPEGAASILWRDPAKAKEAASAMKITALELEKLKVIDEIIKEPLGGAHRERATIFETAKEAILRNLDEMLEIDQNLLVEQRQKKFLNIGRSL